MIDTSSIRIGNYLLLTGSLVQVTEVGIGHVCLHGVCRQTGNPQFPIEFNPIHKDDPNITPYELTDRRLSMLCGNIPTKHGIAYRFSHNATYLIYPDGTGSYFIGLDNKGELQRVTPTPIKYLHELQNIHYAMYGYEMELEEAKLRAAINF